jgi:hypothetical protein
MQGRSRSNYYLADGQTVATFLGMGMHNARKLALVGLVLVSACMHRLSTDMNAWVGRSADDLVSEWGAPARAAELTDGRKVLTWVRSWNTAAEDEHPVMRDCERSFTISAGRVTSWAAHGCPSVYAR